MTYKRRLYTGAHQAENLHLYIDMSGNPGHPGWRMKVAEELLDHRSRCEKLQRPGRVRFTAFTHELSDDSAWFDTQSLIDSPSQLEKVFEELVMPPGGTDFVLVWDRINTRLDRAQRDNVIISDLAWWTTPELIEESHPTKLRYRYNDSGTQNSCDQFARMLMSANIGLAIAIR